MSDVATPPSFTDRVEPSGRASFPMTQWSRIPAARDGDPAECVVTDEMWGTARLWDADPDPQFAVWNGPHDFVLSAVFSRDGRWVLIGNHNTECSLWPADPLAVALERKPRDLTAEEQQRYRVARSVD